MDAKIKSAETELRAWHEAFAACVRARDLAGGSALCAPECQGFGSYAEFAPDRGSLMQNQWRVVWFRTHSFQFLSQPFVVILSPDGEQACVLALWESRGVGEDGVEFPRRGRSTTVLRRAATAPGGWLAVHTHYSKMPGGQL